MHALEEEMKNSSTRVDSSELKNQLLQLKAKEISLVDPSSSKATCNSLKVDFHYPNSHHHPQILNKEGL